MTANQGILLIYLFFLFSYNHMGLHYIPPVLSAGEAQIEGHLSIHVQSCEVWKAVRCPCQTGMNHWLLSSSYVFQRINEVVFISGLQVKEPRNVSALGTLLECGFFDSQDTLCSKAHILQWDQLFRSPGTGHPIANPNPAQLEPFKVKVIMEGLQVWDCAV